ncbi:4-vinyl reductase [Paenibacillus thiaminolyticus]|uniref:4-vinyl reductase n=1 Tax=Paenibacillus thiaminolyticus TaxID=49283 RepID=A0AAP9DW60_PANTH|nr:V4R domain-containing protein [Paenibacillus thiaminolyticus]MCY9533987.1 4-vinyl reductase [Paenibacillus thiaminolyticus]MCY9603784.1 4-vinyl reductase [Paenibacillus thiaminolyticus]MCY9610297.1 4-vinyl reductase [Paenibacillus thiaminolyticus]MCY9614505.1 4-vinyl reductase [Paenibacillus thiaminolyticus]MCY9618966.1 4-vinyl reductase [Paenibacillus thiaminolyticus]
MNRASVVQEFTFDDMAKISRTKLGCAVPIELYRAIRLIGMYQGLPMRGKGTTVTIGRKIGESLPVHSLEELFTMFRGLKIGDPHIVLEEEHKLHVAVKDCFCEGLPEMEGHMVCDLEGAIMEGALTKLKNKRVLVKEIKCNVNGDDCCEYEIRF